MVNSVRRAAGRDPVPHRDGRFGIMTNSLRVGLGLAVLLGGFGAVATLGLESMWPLLLAAVVALVPGTIGRLFAFLVGIGAAWIGLAIRAEFLPFNQVAVGIGIALTIVLVTVVATATAGRLPPWAGLLGAGTFLGVYVPAFQADPGAFLTTSPEALTITVLAAAAGFAAVELVRLIPTVSRREAEPASARSDVLEGV
jgi:hypothetical protein